MDSVLFLNWADESLQIDSEATEETTILFHPTLFTAGSWTMSFCYNVDAMRRNFALVYID